MKLQYLGDSKDSFKWDYHDYLANALGADSLKILWLLTPDDNSNDGASAPDKFIASAKILELCRELKRTRNPELLLEMPRFTKSSYQVSFFEKQPSAIAMLREQFFKDVRLDTAQLIFIDPDNGFEPKTKTGEKYIKYDDLRLLIEIMPDDAVISVFQHHRRKKFTQDYAEISERLAHPFMTAIYWHSLMFVNITKNACKLEQVKLANIDYAKHKPVQTI